MKIKSIETTVVRLPFRFSFKHSLASRDESLNVIVAVTAESERGLVTGFGESIPRDYVTGETVESAVCAIESSYAPLFKERSFTSLDHAASYLKEVFNGLELDKKMMGASWCAFETAVLDALARCLDINLAQWLGPPSQEFAAGVQYGGVVPFGSSKAFAAVIWFYKFFGFKTVKIKVGKNLEDDLLKVRQARKILGQAVTLRVDANCAWNAEEAIRAAELFRPFGVASYEQPVPADDLAGLKRVSQAIPEPVLADESLCSIEQARVLAKEKICTAFNIRVSKVGGLLAAGEISAIARGHGLDRHMGAQVGESGILSAAGRAFASTQERFENYEGSNNWFLLKEDLTKENLNVGANGIGKLLIGPGLGVNVLPERLSKHHEPVVKEQTKHLVTP